MTYTLIPNFNKCQSIIQEETKGKRILNRENGFCISLKAKSILQQHCEDMLKEDGFSYHLLETAKKIINKYELRCSVFVMMDEILFLFPTCNHLILTIGSDNVDTIISTLLCDFTLEFSVYKRCLFDTFGYEIKSSDAHVQEIIKYKKSNGYNKAVQYFCEEFLPKEDYVNKSVSDQIESLKRHKIFEAFKKKSFLYEGFNYKR